MTLLTATSIILSIALLATLAAAIYLLQQAGNVLDFADDLASDRLANAIETGADNKMTNNPWMRRCPAGHLLADETDLAEQYKLNAVYCPVCSEWTNLKGTPNG